MAVSRRSPKKKHEFGASTLGRKVLDAPRCRSERSVQVERQQNMLWVLVQAFSLAAYYQDGADGLVAVRPVEAIALDGPHRQWTVEPGDELLVVRRLGRTAVAQLTVLPPNHRWSDPPNRFLYLSVQVKTHLW